MQEAARRKQEIVRKKMLHKHIDTINDRHAIYYEILIPFTTKTNSKCFKITSIIYVDGGKYVCPLGKVIEGQP